MFRKKGFLKNKKDETLSHNKNLHINESSLKRQIKSELIKDINLSFINDLKNEIKKDLKLELKKEMISQVKEEISIKIKEKIKNELRAELTQEIRKDILLEIQIKAAREKSLRDKIAKNNKKEEIKINVNDEELIKNFLVSEKFEKENNKKDLLILEMKKEDIKKYKVMKEIEIDKTEILKDDININLDKTQIDMGDYSEEDVFFRQHELEVTATESIDKSFKGSVKIFVKEQEYNIKKASKDLKIISKKGIEISREELEKIKNSEAFKGYVQKIRTLKNKNKF